MALQVTDGMFSFINSEMHGYRYVPKNVHTSIRWDGQDPLDELAVTTDTPWQLVKHNKKKSASTKSNVTGFVAARNSICCI